MAKFFYDTEFLDDGERIHLISLGMVAEDGGTLSVINADAPWYAIGRHPWLRENVLPHLPRDEKATRFWMPDFDDPRVMPHSNIAVKVGAFISSYGLSRKEHELWAYYSAYDHVALAQLWGPMIKLPPCVPMFTHDLKQYAGADRLPEQTGAEHDALADAQWVAMGHSYIQSLRLAQQEALCHEWHAAGVKEATVRVLELGEAVADRVGAQFATAPQEVNRVDAATITAYAAAAAAACGLLEGEDHGDARIQALRAHVAFAKGAWL